MLDYRFKHQLTDDQYTTDRDTAKSVSLYKDANFLNCDLFLL